MDELATALGDGDVRRIDEQWESLAGGYDGISTSTLNRLLVTDGHHHHQEVARELQVRADPSSLLYACRAIDMGFSRLAYTASEPEVLGKWYSWLLAGIGTDEATAAIERYSCSEVPGLAEAMRYRLSRLRKP